MREVAPPPILAPFVECFWIRSPGDASPDTPHRVLPDGCLDIIFSSRGALVVGAMTRPLLIPSRTVQAVLGVRFLPGMATAFVQIPAATLTDDSAPLDAVWSDGTQVADLVGSALGSPEAITRVADMLRGRLGRTRPIPADVRAAVRGIVANGGRSEVSQLATSLGLTRQHLARRFAAYVGVTPKMLSRVMRMRETLRRARASAVNWAGIAADLGYSDQSHLVSEFRSLTGLTPSRWAASRRRCSVRPEEAPRP